MHHSTVRFPAGKRKLLIALMSLGLLNITSAQTLVTPTLSDNTWYTSSSNPIAHIETAMIEFGTGHVITAVNDHEVGLGATDYIHLMDDLGNTASIVSTNPVGAVTSLDIVIGNWDGVSTGCTSCTSVATDFILATSFRNNSGQVEIDYYDVYDDGVSTLTITALTALTSKTMLGLYSPLVVHMDLVAEYGNTGITGLPFCNQFVVTWDDGSTNTVYADTSTLNKPRAALAGTLITPNPIRGIMPDVAAIQRSGFPRPRPIHNIALITYVNAATVSLREWDYTANTFSTPTLLDNGSSSLSAAQPRIDALDDFSSNANPANSNYKVVAQTSNGGFPEVRSYDNVLGAGSNFASSGVIDISTVAGFTSYIPPYVNQGPVVSLTSNLDYAIAHWTQIGPDSDIVFMEPVIRTAPSSLVGGDYYWINSDGAPLGVDSGLGSTFAVSVSATVNDPTVGNVFAWGRKNGSNYEVDYKLTSGTFAFRHSPSSIASVQGKKWSVFPNPAANELTINSPAVGTSANYRIMDMKGRVVMQGEIMAVMQTLDVRNLSPGNYVFGLYKNDASDGSLIFVKN